MKKRQHMSLQPKKRNNLPIILFAISTAFLICFIFSNSLQSRAVSSTQSGRVMQFLQRLLDPNKAIPVETFHRFVRKLAHFVEFAALGVSVCGLFLSIRRKTGRIDAGMMLFLVLAVAVADEFIQNFTGRYSSVQDVVLDFGGALFGIVMMHLGAFLLFRILKKE